MCQVTTLKVFFLSKASLKTYQHLILCNTFKGPAFLDKLVNS